MEESVKILCLGGAKFFWNPIKLQLLEDLSGIGIDAVFYTNTFESVSSEEKLIKTIALITPDIVIINGLDFNTKLKLEMLSTSLKRQFNRTPPVFIISANLKDYFSSLVSQFDTLSCSVPSFGKISNIPQEAILYNLKNESPSIEISPQPEFTTTKELDKKSTFTFFSKKETTLALWEGEQLKFKDFLKAINQKYKTKFKLSKTFGIATPEKYILLSGFSMREIEKFYLDDISIVHFCTQKCLKEKGSEYHCFFRKISHYCHAKLLQKISLSFDKRKIITSNVKVVIEAKYPILTNIFSFILKNEEIKKICIRQNTALSPDEIKLSIQVANEKDTLHIHGSSREFPLKQKLLKHFSNNFKNYEHLLRSPFQTRKIQQQFKALTQRHADLKQLYLQSVETESLDEKDQYIQFIVNRKIDIIQNLIDKAHIKDPASDVTVDFFDKTALIFYDQRKHAEILNEKLKRIKEKKLFLNVSEKLTSFKDLLGLETDNLEPFLTQGLVICTKTCKIMLEHNLKKIKYYLEKNKQQNLSVTIRKLHHEISQCRGKLQNYIFLKTCTELEKKFFQVRDDFFNKMENIWQKRNDKLLFSQKAKRISIFSDQNNISNILESSLQSIVPKTEILSKTIQYSLITHHTCDDVKNFTNLYPNPKERKIAMGKDLSIQNANNLSIFFNRIILNINNFDPEVVIFYLKNELLSPLLTILQNTPAINQIPILAFIAPNISIEAFQSLLKMGVHPILLPISKEDSSALYSNMLQHFFQKRI